LGKWESFLKAKNQSRHGFKTSSPFLSEAARAEGSYRDHTYKYCLPREYAGENLFFEIREPIKTYFAQNGIKWHDGHDGNPSNHLCDSQVCCANFIFPFFNKPEALAALMRPLFPDLREMVDIEDGQFVAFEWIGKHDYLGEKAAARNKKRSRGAISTSADAAVMFRRRDGLKQIVLIEWKYTESYFSTPLKIR